MLKMQVITFWNSMPEGMIPDLARLLQPGDSMMDVTGEVAPVDTPHPNPVIVEVWGTQATLDAIMDDSQYGQGAILFQWEEVEDGQSESSS